MINRNRTAGHFVIENFGEVTTDGPDPLPGGVIHRIKRRGSLICGVLGGHPGFADFDPTAEEWSGLDVDFCRALTASLFGGKIDNTTLIIQEVEMENRFRALANESVDVMCGLSVNLVSDVREPTTGEGFSFSSPYYYNNEK